MSKTIRYDEDAVFDEEPHQKEWKYSKKDRKKLQRYLASRVGDSWDDVYSDLKKKFSERILRDYLELDVSLSVSLTQDDQWIDGFGVGVNDFYVHPQTKKLERIKKSAKKKSKDYEDKVITIGDKDYFSHRGLWYNIRYVELDIASIDHRFPSKEDLNRKHDHFPYNNYIYHHDSFETYRDMDKLTPFYLIQERAMEVYGRLIYVIHAEQVNKKEIKTLKRYLSREES